MGSVLNIISMHQSMAAAEARVEELLQPDDQDKRIAALKRQLRDLIGQEEFTVFYRTTSFNSATLERQLREKLAECLPKDSTQP